MERGRVHRLYYNCVNGSFVMKKKMFFIILRKVHNFYEYWMNFESWRDFSLAGEHDLEDAQDRFEKRWMMKENERKAKVNNCYKPGVSLCMCRYC